MNKQQLQQEIAELQKQLEEKQKALSAMPDKWEPKGGEFMVSADGDVSQLTSYAKCRLFGMEYPTREQAEKAAKAMRAHNRLLAYVAEFAPDWEVNLLDGDVEKWFVRKHPNGQYLSDYFLTTIPEGAVFMPQHVAQELAIKLNLGEVEL